MSFDPERQRQQCDKGYHQLAWNVATVLRNGMHRGTMYCIHCPRHFDVNEFKVD